MPNRYIPLSVRRRIWSMPCVICGFSGDTEVDHIVPSSQGGTSDEPNLQPLCRVCNAIKRDRKTNMDVFDWIKGNPDEFAKKRENREARRKGFY